VTDTFVQTETHSHVTVLRINRPEAMNALSTAVLRDLIGAMRDVGRDPEVHCVVLTGAPRPDGMPCFSAGVDLKEAASSALAPDNPGRRLTELIDECLTPSIAAIDGVCTTGALEVALSCDLRIVADTAQISDWHLARLGAGLGAWGASTRLARLVGVAQAKDLILTGKVIDGHEALRIGLAQRVVPSAELWDETMRVADAVAAMRPEGVRMTLAHLDKVQDLSKEESLAFARQVSRWFGRGPDFTESAEAILARKDAPPEA
jgi:enoyl-CoA hydratase/carnithine racemase